MESYTAADTLVLVKVYLHSTYLIAGPRDCLAGNEISKRLIGRPFSGLVRDWCR